MIDDGFTLDPTSISTILSIPDGKSHADDWLDDMVYMLRVIKNDYDSIISAYVKDDQRTLNEVFDNEMEDKE
jgi:hypothetical protein